MSADPADRGLLTTLLELRGARGTPATTAAIAGAVGIPDEYQEIVERRLELNRRRGYVDRDHDGRWHATAAGVAAVTLGPGTGSRSPSARFSTGGDDGRARLPSRSSPDQACPGEKGGGDAGRGRAGAASGPAASADQVA